MALDDGRALRPMISHELERLEQTGGHAVAPGHPHRWYAASVSGSFARLARASGPSVCSSGRVRGPGDLRAERSEDGLLVTAPAALGGERIVWVGDVELVAVDGARPMALPRVTVDPDRARVDVVWVTRSKHLRLRLSVPCRPADSTTRENDVLDAEVETLGERSVRIRPYPGLPALRIEVDGRLAFEAEPDWWRDVIVFDRVGRELREDRFVPGTFVVRPRPGSRTLRLTVSVEPPACARPHPETAQRRRLVQALAAPGFLGGWDETASWIEAAADELTSTGDSLEDDGPLWLARVASLAFASGAPSEIVHDVLRPAISSIVDAVTPVEVELDPAARLRGAARWFESLAGRRREPSPSVGVETGALLHQAYALASSVAAAAGDDGGAATARRLALRTQRWFQRSFWLATPRRLSDVEIDRIAPGDASALALRPHMLIAASLGGGPLDRAQVRAVVRAAEDFLVTSLGLSSVDPRMARSQRRQDGARWTWPWLIGPYVEASLRGFGPDRGRARVQRALLAGLANAPEAWSERDGGEVVPLGALDFPPNAGEAVRASELLSGAPRGGAVS
ncbi:MAG: amylo-alpha-1,6-glucosidase [Planctomycetota bacterium]